MRKKNKEERRNSDVTFTIPLNVPNKYGVIYKEDAMKTAVEDYVEKHKGKPMLGCLNPGMSRASMVTSFLNVSHKITGLKIKDGGICGILLDTPMGKIVQDLKDTSLTFAPNIIGTVKTEKKEDGTWQRIVMDCSIVSIDII